MQEQLHVICPERRRGSISSVVGGHVHRRCICVPFSRERFDQVEVNKDVVDEQRPQQYLVRYKEHLPSRKMVNPPKEADQLPQLVLAISVLTISMRAGRDARASNTLGRVLLLLLCTGDGCTVNAERKATGTAGETRRVYMSHLLIGATS